MTKRMDSPQGDKDADVTSWENIKATNRPLIDLRGRSCVAGIDYASTTDFVAVGLLFVVDDLHYWITHTWVCRQCKDLSRIKFPLEEAAQRGLLTWVDDVEISPDIPAKWLQNQAEFYDIRGVAIDKFRYTLLSKSLRAVGFDTEKKAPKGIKLVRPSDEMMIAPTITSLFANHSIIWGDHPLMRWYTNNTKIEQSSAGNITYGKKEAKSRKTDGFKAFVAAEIISDRLAGTEIPDIDLGVYTY